MRNDYNDLDKRTIWFRIFINYLCWNGVAVLVPEKKLVRFMYAI